MFAPVSKRTKSEQESIPGKIIIEFVGRNFSNFEAKKLKGSLAMDYNAVDKKCEIYLLKVQTKPLLETSGHRN